MEVLLVLAILVILGTLVVTNFSGVLAGSKIRAAQTQLNALSNSRSISTNSTLACIRRHNRDWPPCESHRPTWQIRANGKGRMQRRISPRIRGNSRTSTNW